MKIYKITKINTQGENKFSLLINEEDGACLTINLKSSQLVFSLNKPTNRGDDKHYTSTLSLKDFQNHTLFKMYNNIDILYTSLLDIIPECLTSIAEEGGNVMVLHFKDNYRHVALSAEVKLNLIDGIVATGGTFSEIQELGVQVKALKSTISALIVKETENEEFGKFDKINIESYKKNYQESSYFASDPSKLVFHKDITTNANNQRRIDNIFCIFNSKLGEDIIVWHTPEFFICAYDLQKEVITHEFLAHDNMMLATRHFYDCLGDRDIIISSSYDRNVKLWDASANYQNILTIASAHDTDNIYSVMIINVNCCNYVVSSCWDSSDSTKVWDFTTGEYIKSLGKDQSYYLGYYYDMKKRKHYVINGNEYDVKSYDFVTGLEYKRYTPGSNWHMSALVRESDDVTEIVCCVGNYGYIYIYNFHTVELIKKCDTYGGYELRGISLWNWDFLAMTGSDGKIKLLDMVDNKRICELEGHSGVAACVKKFEHHLYGESLVSFSNEGKIKLWVNKNKITN
jgi:WD40 repeat protein